MEAPMDKKCNGCGKQFNPSKEGIVGQLNGKPVAYCGPCCREE